MKRQRRHGVTKQPMAMVPYDLERELRAVSKAALGDLVWDLAQAAAGERSPEAEAMVRKHLKLVLTFRAQENARRRPAERERRKREAEVRAPLDFGYRNEAEIRAALDARRGRVQRLPEANEAENDMDAGASF